MRFLEDPAVKLAVVLFGSGLILTGLVLDAGLMARLTLIALGAVQTLVLLLRRQ
jgi:energy-converting hydrogenase Eha subunit E